MVIQGHRNTLPVTLDEMIYHTRIVSRGVENAIVVADLPFLSYQTSVPDAVRSAGRILKESGAEGVKLEGGNPVLPQIRAMVSAGIPVMGHLGITPQSIHLTGGYKVQGTTPEAAKRIVTEAMAVEEAGAFALLLEGIPGSLSEKISKKLSIPTIGIGAGKACDGQVLVLYDLLGLYEEKIPKFVRRYANLGKLTKEAVSRYKTDVENGKFPSSAESY